MQARRRTIHIERKDRGAVDDALRALRPALRQHRVALAAGPLTAVQASTWTGLPVDVAEAALLSLVSRHEAFLDVSDVSEDGVLLFRVVPASPTAAAARAFTRWMAPLRRQWRKAADVVHRARRAAEDAFLYVFSPLLLLVFDANVAGLLAPAMTPSTWSGIYAVIPGMLLFIPIGLVAVLAIMQFVLMMLAFAGVVLLGGGVVLLLGSVAIACTERRQPAAAVFVFVLGAGSVALGVPWARTALAGLRESMSRASPDSLSWGVWRAIRHFLLGPQGQPTEPPHALYDPSPDPDGLRDEARLTALLARRTGRVHARDLVALFGWSLDDVERELTRVLLDYGGSIDVDDDGVMTFVFPHGSAADPTASSHARAEALAPLVHRAGQADARPRLWDPEEQNVPAIFMACGIALSGLLLLAALSPGQVILLPSLADLHETSVDNPRLLARGLGLWPYLLGAAVLVPRALSVALRVRRVRRRQAVRATFGTIIDAAADRGPPTCWLSDAQLRMPLVRGLRGEIDVEAGTRDVDGVRHYRVAFPALARPASPATGSRASADHPEEPGDAPRNADSDVGAALRSGRRSRRRRQDR